MPVRFDDPRNDDDPLSQRFLGALAVSLLLHVTAVAVAQLGTQLHWWDAQPFSIFRKVRLTPEEIAKIQEAERKREQEAQKQQDPPTLTFVQVSQPSAEPPPEAKYYSSASSQAANPEPSNLTVTKIDGRQAQVLRTEDVPRTAPGRSAPSPPPSPSGSAESRPAAAPPPRAEPVAQAVIPELAPRQPEPERAPGVGDLALATPPVEPIRPDPPTRPADSAREAVPPKTPTPVNTAATTPPTPNPSPALTTPSPTTATTPSTARPRPRSVVEAKLRQELLSGEKAKQTGGVSRKGPVQLDVKGTPFGAYDEAIVLAVQARWFALLDEKRFAGGTSGRVVVQFKLYSDGSVRIVEPHESTVDALYTVLCVRAVRDPAPFEKWSADMTRMVGSNFREMRFTFYYN